MSTLVPLELVERRIFYLRGSKVMVDADLARLYDVPTKSLNLAVRRNQIRFPEDFAFQLTWEEVRDLRFQSETSSWGGRRYQPYVFTEQGVAMLSSVLRSKRAAIVNIAIMRAFVKLREVMATHKDLSRKLEDLERRLHKHDGRFKTHATKIRKIFDAIWQLMNPPKAQAGFRK